MKKFRLLFIITALTFVGQNVPAQTIEPRDNDYWLVVPANYMQSVGLSMWSEANNKIRIKYGSTQITRTINTGSPMESSMPLIPDHKKIVKRGIHVWSLDSLPFKLSLIIGPEEFGELSWCMPTNALGKCYRIAGYNSIDSVNGGQTLVIASEFAVAATQDSTHITIDFPPGKGLAPIHIAMNAGEAYHIDCGRADVGIDPTGTRVTADKPIAVYAGHKRAAVPIARAQTAVDGIANCLLEQMIPVEAWGQIHMVVSSVTRSEDSFRFLADQDATDIYIDGVKIATITTAGQYYETILSGPHEIYSSKPIMVAQYAQSGVTAFGTGGPAMLIVPPVDRYFSSTNFKFEGSLSLALPAICIFVPQAYTGQVEYDGVLINSSTFAPLPNSANNPVPYSFGTILNPAVGYHTLRYNPMPATNQYSLMGYLVAGDLDRDENELQSLGYRGTRYPVLDVKNILDAGTLTCDTDKTLTIPVKNVGSGILVIDSAVIRGTNPNDFILVSPTRFPDTLSFYSKKDYTIRFVPQTTGDRTAELRIYSKDYDCDAHGLVPKLTIVTLRGHKDIISITRSPASIDYGYVTCSEVIDTTITITNTGTANVIIAKPSFTNDNGTFKILSPTTIPFTIAPGATQNVRIRFFANTIPTGAYNSTVTVKGSPCNVLKTVDFTASRLVLSYDLQPPLVDFGVVDTNTTVSNQARFDNKNPGVTVRVKEAIFVSTFPGKILTSFPFTLPANQQLAIDFNASPTQEGTYTTEMQVTVDSPCTDTRRMRVQITAASLTTCPKPASVNLKHPGEAAEIPIVMENTEKVKDASVVTVEMKYDPDLIRVTGGPIAPDYGTIENPTLNESAGLLSFTLRVKAGQQLPTPNATLGTIPVQALLASRLKGEVRVTTSTVTVGTNTITSKGCPAEFTLDESCTKTGELKTRSGFAITSIYPNPSTVETTVAVKVYDDLAVQMEVVDVYGRVVDKRDVQLAKGDHHVALTTKNYAAGLYFLRMRSEGNVETKSFNVER